ncbi:MAG TPA: helix-turn-helix transcriptional regulator [Chloroflexota bacterium]|nr:helix-turn-helix transcriptional regulator [Chloroflexota bacterium]
MSLAVYSRVGSLLQEAGVDLEDLRARVAARYGVSIDRRTLDALTRDGRLQRPDIEVLEAIALILQIPVDDLLDVRTVGVAEPASGVSDDVLLDTERDARLRALAEQRDWGELPLSPVEQRELETLIAEAGRALVERDLAAAAQRLDLPVEVARMYIATQTADATQFWSDLMAEPERMAAEVRVAKARRQVRAG